MLKLLTRQTCPSCGGARVRQHPPWAQFWREWKARKGTHVELQDGSVERWFQSQGHDQLPPEEVLCEICEGVGEVDGTISVPDLARLLKAADNGFSGEGPGVPPR